LVIYHQYPHILRRATKQGSFVNIPYSAIILALLKSRQDSRRLNGVKNASSVIMKSLVSSETSVMVESVAAEFRSLIVATVAAATLCTYLYSSKPRHRETTNGLFAHWLFQINHCFTFESLNQNYILTTVTKIIQHQSIITASHQPVFDPPHAARQDQHLHRPCLSDLVKSAPIASE